jgi:hypothetical protein
MTEVLMDEVVETDYGQFDLVWGEDGEFDGDDDRSFAGQVNGLVGAANPDGLYISLARRSGGSQVRIVLHDTEPPEAEDTWEDVVEVSVVVPPDADAGWTSWGGDSGGDLALPAGCYRVRVSARGRDAGQEDEFADGIVDHYLVEFWTAPTAPDAILRVGSDSARYWHKEWGSRR